MHHIESMFLPEEFIDGLPRIVKKKILECKYINVFFDKPELEFTIKDEPNFGVNTDNPNKKTNDFNSTNSMQQKSIGTDIVDARFVYFKMRLNANCIK